MNSFFIKTRSTPRYIKPSPHSLRSMMTKMVSSALAISTILPQKPAPTTDELPTKDIGSTGVHLVTGDWGRVEIVGVGTFQTPRMSIPLTPGVYQIQRVGLPETMVRVTVRNGEAMVRSTRGDCLNGLRDKRPARRTLI